MITVQPDNQAPQITRGVRVPHDTVRTFSRASLAEVSGTGEPASSTGNVKALPAGPIVVESFSPDVVMVDLELPSPEGGNLFDTMRALTCDVETVCMVPRSSRLGFQSAARCELSMGPVRIFGPAKSMTTRQGFPVR